LALSLAEDLGDGDITTLATVSRSLAAQGLVRANEACVVAGLTLFEDLRQAFVARRKPEEEAASLALAETVDEGATVARGGALCRIGGNARALLTFERVFLNFVARLSGIATLTAASVEKAGAVGGGVRVLDTRKTTPAHRSLEKYAVRCGGGSNHRFGLYDGVLIKDNHVSAAGGVAQAVRAARQRAASGTVVECECDRIEQVREALEAGADAVLLDNFSPQRVRQAVELIAGKARIEVSGNVTLESIAEYAASGADAISVGRLTHSARAIDLSMEVELSS